MNYSDIKLVIWDLDETLWKGTLSEENIIFSEDNKKLIYDLVSSGVMCSICSKNEPEPVIKELKKLEIKDFFVFNSINWTPKGNRIKDIISQMNLRQPNVLFVDDNPSNRAEALNYCPDIMIADVDIIPSLSEYFSQTNNLDPTHERLKRYQLLEKKKKFQAKAGNNIEFLRQSNIQVKMNDNCLENIDRIHELINRTNQLNFTKFRSTKEELNHLLNDVNAKCSYVTVTDNFGDYGIVGFVAIKESMVLHFTFSCRILGMGVEQYVYKLLKKPNINIVGEVSSNLESPNADWINNSAKTVTKKKTEFNNQKIILKGPCDLEQIFAYIAEGQNIITEFVYVNDNGVRISQGTHTMHIVQSRLLSNENIIRLSKELPFGDIDMFKTQIFDSDVDFIVLSLFADPSFGLYKERKSGIIVAYGEYINDLTDKTKWGKYINGEVFLSNCKFTEDDLKYFSKQYEFIGRISPEDVIRNLDDIYKSINDNAKLILVLGSEIEYLNNVQEAYVDRHEYHKILNAYVRKWQTEKERVYILDINEFVTQQSDFTNNINHFNRSIYYKMSQKLIQIISSCGGEKLRQNHLLRMKIKEYVKTFKNKLLKLIGSLKKHYKI